MNEGKMKKLKRREAIWKDMMRYDWIEVLGVWGGVHSSMPLQWTLRSYGPCYC